MTKQEVVNAAISIVEELRSMVPRDTGNMAYNALRYELQGDVLDITVDPAIAPYVYFTNEPWVSPKWNGKQNPNEGWWQRFVEEFSRRLATKLKGELI